MGGDRTVHYRPREYCAAGTRIALNAAVYGVDLGGGVYRETDREMSLIVGRSKIAVIDDRTKQMVVSLDGKKVLTVPVSMGRAGLVTGEGQEDLLPHPERRDGRLRSLIRQRCKVLVAFS